MSDDLLFFGAIAAGALIAVAIVVLLARAAWRRQARRYVARLTSYREAVKAAFESVRRMSATFANGDDAALVAFAFEAETEERRALGEIAARMDIAAEELAVMALPRRLVAPADALADAASALAAQAREIADAHGDAALDALGRIDLVSVVSLLQDGTEQLARAAEAYGAEQDTVYGGGLYI
ncbi:MAG: hypothetical protein QMC79_01490 [Anaerosomatales bacterium]|nr:hypothetical protein [Anaerosomatales bacterium]